MEQAPAVERLGGFARVKATAGLWAGRTGLCFKGGHPLTEPESWCRQIDAPEAMLSQFRPRTAPLGRENWAAFSFDEAKATEDWWSVMFSKYLFSK
jgi:hypothetical protein